MKGFMLLLFLALMVVLAMWAGWFGVSTTDQGGKTHITATFDKDEVKRDVESTEQKVRNLGGKERETVVIEKDTNEPPLIQEPLTTLFSIDKESIILGPGAAAVVTLTRSGKLEPRAVAMTPAEGTGIKAQNIEFAEGQASKTIVIEAPLGAKDGLVTFEYMGQTEGVYVNVLEPGEKRDVPVTDTAIPEPLTPEPGEPEVILPPPGDGSAPVKPPVLPDESVR